MNGAPNLKLFDPRMEGKDFRMRFFSELVKLPVCAGAVTRRLGPLTDLVFRQAEPYPEAIGIYLFHGWGKPTEFIPWDKVVKIDEDAIFVQPPPEGSPQYPPFVDQPGWILLQDHLMGKTIFDMDGRRTEVVNDVHLLESRGRMLLVHVDVSFNGFWRKWGLRRLVVKTDQFISWKYVQPLSVEDAVKTDAVTLSITRSQIKELPSEDLADALEELSGKEQQAVFSALDSEKAAETLIEAEPRAQRQIVASLRKERAQNILSEMSLPQVVDLLSVLPHEDSSELLALLPKDKAARVKTLLSADDISAAAVMDGEFLAMPRETTVGEALRRIRSAKVDHVAVSYVYITAGPENALAGVVDLRDLVLADDHASLGDIMAAPVVTVTAGMLREELTELFIKYHYRMAPVVDARDVLLGVVHYHDVMKGPAARLLQSQS